MCAWNIFKGWETFSKISMWFSDVIYLLFGLKEKIKNGKRKKVLEEKK